MAYFFVFKKKAKQIKICSYFRTNKYEFVRKILTKCTNLDKIYTSKGTAPLGKSIWKGAIQMPVPVILVAAGTVIGFIGRAVVLADREKKKN